MVVLQILNKIIATQNYQIVLNNNLTKDMFTEYEDEFDYINNFFESYQKVPDRETFLSTFPEFSLIDVRETDRFLLDKLHEEYLYKQIVPIIQETAQKLQVDSKEAVSYLEQSLPKLLGMQKTEGIDIIEKAQERLDVYKTKLEGDNNTYISTGFRELDEAIKGFATGEELVVLFARIGQGKSWVLTKMLSNAWQIGLNVGMVSPEMSATKIGYRFDTLTNNFNNNHLVWGYKEEGYDKYIEDLPKKKKNKFIVTIPKDFDKRITISKLKTFCQQNKIDILGIDGITYLTDERYKHGDNRTTMLTNISEDLMGLSIELQIPIIVVVQSNRGGVNKDDNNETPDLENIKDSDGIAANATKVIAIRQKPSDNTLQLCVRKHRDGRAGQNLVYSCDLNVGKFTYLQGNSEAVSKPKSNTVVRNEKRTFEDDIVAF